MSSPLKQTLEYLQSFAFLVLMLVGLTGFAYHLFRQNGWVETITGGAWDFTLRSPLMALVVAAGAIYLGITWRRTRTTRREHGRVATILFYCMVASGAYFLGRLVIVGTL